MTNKERAEAIVDEVANARSGYSGFVKAVAETLDYVEMKALARGFKQGLKKRTKKTQIRKGHGMEAIAQLKDDTTGDYWVATEGNAKQPLKRLLLWAEQHPEAVFSGD